MIGLVTDSTAELPVDLTERFAIEVVLRDPRDGGVKAGRAVALTRESGAFWFFDGGNPELVVKLVDGSDINGSFWLYYASLTDVEFDLKATDRRTGRQRTYHNPHGTMASVADTAAFSNYPVSLDAQGTKGATPSDLVLREASPGSGCHDVEGALCLGGGRFRVEVQWREPRSGTSGTGRAAQRSAAAGMFWFFTPDKAELAVKILDGVGVNGHFWVFYASLTDVEFDLTLTDTAQPGQPSRTYHNPPFHMASFADTEAF